MSSAVSESRSPRIEFICAIDVLSVLVGMIETEHMTELVQRDAADIPGAARADVAAIRVELKALLNTMSASTRSVVFNVHRVVMASVSAPNEAP